jgi:prevent-host-death family protein
MSVSDQFPPTDLSSLSFLTPFIKSKDLTPIPLTELHRIAFYNFLQLPLLDSYKKAIKIAISYVEGMKMKVANTVELKNKTNKILREVMKGQPVIITYRGKPAASLTPLSDEGLEDFILENSPKIRKMISEAVKDVKEGKLTSLEEYMKAS